MKYVKFTEINDNEGEEWNFYLPIAGNEDKIEELKCIIAEDEECYCISDELLEESEVDVLEKHGGSGYMSYHNKCTGKLTLTKNTLDDLYKGGIMSMFTID